MLPGRLLLVARGSTCIAATLAAKNSRRTNSGFEDVASCSRESSRTFGQRLAPSYDLRISDVSCFLCGPITAVFLFDLEMVSNRRVGTQMRILVAGRVLLAVIRPSVTQGLSKDRTTGTRPLRGRVRQRWFVLSRKDPESHGIHPGAKS
jgi:hypothetical protein